MAAFVLAGDVGGTKTNLAVYAVHDGGVFSLVREGSFASQHYGSLGEVVADFLSASSESIDGAAFGIAGPVFDGVVQVTNLPWRVEARRLAEEIGTARVRLLNDLEATAYGALFLPESEIRTLNPGVARRGHRAVIAAGTGLGQALLLWDGTRHRPSATEGGHADFAPRNPREAQLLEFLLRDAPRVSCERVLSGPGLARVFDFVSQVLDIAVEAAVRTRLAEEGVDASAVIGAAGVQRTCAACSEAVDLFVSLYGAQAGNLALTAMALGGVYVGGGIVTKLLPRVEAGGFLDAFRAKQPFDGLMAEIPLQVILNPKASQLGAAHIGAELLEDAGGGDV